MPSTARVEVSYGQIAVFAGGLDRPFNDWTERHVAQGFAWRPGSVSFRTLVEAGVHALEIDLVDDAGEISAQSVRAIEVPFEVPSDGGIEIGSISDTVPLKLPPGTYLLRCEFLGGDAAGDERVRLVFARRATPRFAVLRADEALSADGQLLTTAEAAVG